MASFHEHAAEASVNAAIGLAGGGMVAAAAGDRWPMRQKVVHVVAGGCWAMAAGPGLSSIPWVGRFSFALVFVAGHVGGAATYWFWENTAMLKGAATAWLRQWAGLPPKDGKDSR